MATDIHDCLKYCLRLFQQLGDVAGQEACRRALAQPHRHEPTSDCEVLTIRERQVAELVARGLTNRQIAAELGIASGTAGRHVSNILEKLAVHSRAEIASWQTRFTVQP
jgi:DNA-binding NarL/FixJ family response regulator